MCTKINRWKRIGLVFLVISTFFSLKSQEEILLKEPDYGLAVTGTGMTICAVGTTMSQSPQSQYSGRYGINHVRFNSQESRTLRLSTMAVGALITITGIYLQNRKKKKNHG